jgi:hypothetical protein
MIDHTQAFQYNKRLLDVDHVSSIPQTMWERLQTIPDSVFEEALAGALDGSQIDAFLARRQLLVELRSLCRQSQARAASGAGVAVFQCQ